MKQKIFIRTFFISSSATGSGMLPGNIWFYFLFSAITSQLEKVLLCRYGDIPLDSPSINFKIICQMRLNFFNDTSRWHSIVWKFYTDLEEHKFVRPWPSTSL